MIENFVLVHNNVHDFCGFQNKNVITLRKEKYLNNEWVHIK